MPRPRIHPKFCVQCGGPKARKDAQLCRNCWLSSRQGFQCVDCGKRTQHHAAERCWECYVAKKSAEAVKTCSRSNCDKPHFAKGLCQSHYQVGRRTGFGTTKQFDRKMHTQVRLEPCAVCGYSRMRSEVHRIIPKGPYVVGNMVPVCSRCHDEIERGLTPCPPAWQPAELHMG